MVRRIAARLRHLSDVEKGMLVCIVVLLLLVVMRWDYVRHSAYEGWQWLQPVDSAASVAPQITLQAAPEEACE